MRRFSIISLAALGVFACTLSAGAQALGPQRQFLAIEPYYERTMFDVGEGRSKQSRDGYGGRLWINTDRNGKQYLNGRLSSEVRILVFKNEFRTEEKHPPNIMYLAPIERQDEAGRTEKPADEFLVDELAGGEETAQVPRRFA